MAGLPLSVLDLAMVPAGQSSSDALAATTTLARHAEALGLVGLAWLKTGLTPAEIKAGLSPSHCAVLARTPEALGFLEGRPGWRPLTPERVTPWTDDHANLLSILKRGR